MAATTTLEHLADGVLTATLDDWYTVPANTKAVVHNATFCNTTGAVVLLTVAIVPRSGGTARTVLSSYPVAVNETYPAPELVNLALEAGGKLQASGLGLVMQCSGVEVVGG